MRDGGGARGGAPLVLSAGERGLLGGEQRHEDEQHVPAEGGRRWEELSEGERRREKACEGGERRYKAGERLKRCAKLRKGVRQVEPDLHPARRVAVHGELRNECRVVRPIALGWHATAPLQHGGGGIVQHGRAGADAVHTAAVGGLLIEAYHQGRA